MVILRKQVLNQAVWKLEEKTAILATPNKEKNIFEDFIDSSDIQPLYMPRKVDKELGNVMPGFEDSLTKLKLDNNFLNKS